MSKTVALPASNSDLDLLTRALDRRILMLLRERYGTRPLGEVATVCSGGTPSTSNPLYWGGDHVWVTPKDLGKATTLDVDDSDRRITDAGLQSSSARLLPVGTVLLSSRAPIGYVGISAVPLATNQGFKNVIPSGELDSRYLAHMLRGSLRELREEGRGNTFHEIPARTVNGLHIAVPPLGEQRTIAAFLDAVYNLALGETSAVPTPPPSLNSGGQEILDAAEIGQQVATVRRIAACAPSVESLFRSEVETVLTELPARAKLGVDIDILSGATPSTSNFALWNGDVVWVTPKDLGRLSGRDIEDSERTLTTAGIEACSAQRVPVGSVVMSCRAPIGYLGIARVKLATNQGCKSFLCPQGWLPEFLYYSLMASLPRIKDAGSGTTFHEVSNTKLQGLEIPAADTLRQREIVAHLDSMRTKVAEYNKAAMLAERDAESLLPAYFDWFASRPVATQA
jgi:type I restriction enzyme S subunit